MVEAEFRFFLVQMEGVFRDALEPGKSAFRMGPKGRYAIDTRLEIGKFIPAVIDLEVLCIANVDKPIVSGSSVGMNGAVEADTPRRKNPGQIP